MSGGKTISTSETRAEVFQFQSSAQGVTVPVVHGVTRVPGNLLDYLNFQAIPHTTSQSSGGKGGAPKIQNTTYTYEVSVVMGLGEGPYNGVSKIWVGKATYGSPGALGGTLLGGSLGQAVWSPLTTLLGGAHALGYSGMACVAVQAYNLGGTAQIDNHNFEVVTPSAYQYAGLPDAVPSTIVTDWVTNQRWGGGASSALLGDMTDYDAYCKCAGFLLSPALTEQASLSDRLNTIADLTNTQIVKVDSQIHFVPLGDEPLTGVGVSYTPDLVPIYDLTPDQFICNQNESPIRIKRKTPADAFNQVKVEYRDRSADYNTAIAAADDLSSVQLYGPRPAPNISADWVCNLQTAQIIAQVWLKRYRYILNTYEFRLPWNFADLLPTNIVTLTDLSEGLDREPVRIKTITEDPDGYVIEADQFPHSVASYSLYDLPVSDGFKHDYNASPGAIADPLFIEPPVELTTTGLEVWVAVAGNSPEWGGCNVWVSYTGTDYKLMGTAYGGARYGALTASLGTAPTDTVSVALAGNGGQLLSTSALDAANMATLCWVRGTGSTDKPEFFAYDTATLTSTNNYDLTNLVRGAYDSVISAESSGALFARVDDALIKSEPLQPSMVGQTLYFKFQSFNVFGSGLEDLSTVAEYTYSVRGDMALLPPANVTSFVVGSQADGTRQFTWGWGTTAKPKDLRGYVVRFRQGAGPYAWEDMAPFATDDGFQTASPIESNMLLAGPYVFAIKTVDNFGVQADSALFIDATLPDPRLGNAIEFVDEYLTGWLGTKSQCSVQSEIGENILVVDDQATWGGTDPIPSTWDTWARWVWDPYTSFTYSTAPIDFGASVAVLPVVNYVAEGTVTFEAATSTDGTTWSAYAAVAGPVITRYIKTRITVAIPSGSSTGPGVTPVCVLSRLSVAYIGKVSSEVGNDEDPSTYTGIHRIGAGHVRLPTQKVWVHISRVTLALQSVGGGWSWSLIDKNGTDGPEIKIFNGTTLADPPLIDWMIEGITT